MSLVGSLEDLGLEDILQIVSLSRKSGLLLLRSDTGEGRIVFRDGLVRAAFAKDEPEDLRGLLVGGGFVSATDFESAVETARSRECALDDALAECGGISGERLESLRREHVERAVLRMFTWYSGEFSFDVRDEIDERDTQLLLPVGINTQYLAMEATRVGDESGHTGNGEAVVRAGETSEGDPDAAEGLVFSGEGAVSEEASEPEPPAPEESEAPDAHQALALAAAHRAEVQDLGSERVDTDESASPEVAAATLPPAASAGPAGLIAIDPDLDTLEWLKSSLRGLFPRIHIFQRCEGGVARIRQYLSRAEVPLVLLSATARADSLTGASDVGGLVSRLKALAPRMPILVMHEQDADAPPGVEGADDRLAWPEPHRRADARRPERLEEAAETLREQLRIWAERSVVPAARSQHRGERVDVGGPHPAPAAAGLRRLKEMSRRLHDPSSRGEVLFLVLEFAAASFSRVAMFMLRDDVAEGMAQVGLPATGGPDDEEFRRFQIAAHEPGWFRSVIEGRQARQSAPSDEGDWQLTARLGTAAPEEAYVAPIESGDRVVALLYGDNLPDKRPIGDTTALEIVLLEAGLALDRALLERTLSEVEGGDRAPTAEE
jgi:hypothetical protein